MVKLILIAAAGAFAQFVDGANRREARDFSQVGPATHLVAGERTLAKREALRLSSGTHMVSFSGLDIPVQRDSGYLGAKF